MLPGIYREGRSLTRSLRYLTSTILRDQTRVAINEHQEYTSRRMTFQLHI